MQDKPLLKLENINFGYGKKALLKKANLAIYAGQSIGIVGDNGTGKSTIVKLILGLIRPEYGKIELFGKPASWKNAHPNLGYIGDPSHNSGELGLPDGILVEEMVECFRVLCEIPSPSGTNNKQSSQDLWDLPPGDFFEQLIDLLKIKTFYSRDVGRLSNGERKKLMTLLAIGKQPDLLIADEATEGLDKTAKPIVLNIIEEGIKKQKFALLWISHRWDEIVRLGEVIYELSPSEQERGILKKIVPNQLSINVDLDGKIEVDDLQNDLQFSLLGTLLSNEKSKDVNQININILRP